MVMTAQDCSDVQALSTMMNSETKINKLSNKPTVTQNAMQLTTQEET